MGWAGRGAITRPPLHLQNEIDPKMVATEQPDKQLILSFIHPQIFKTAGGLSSGDHYVHNKNSIVEMRFPLSL